MEQLVFKHDDQTVTTSQHIARAFGKEHFHVLRDIQNLLDDGSLELHPSLDSTNSYWVKQETYTTANGRQAKQYVLSEESHAIAVMGYTTPQAMNAKKLFISQFLAERRRGSDLELLERLLDAKLISEEERKAKADEVHRRYREEMEFLIGCLPEKHKALASKSAKWAKKLDNRPDWM